VVRSLAAVAERHAAESQADSRSVVPAAGSVGAAAFPADVSVAGVSLAQEQAVFPASRVRFATTRDFPECEVPVAGAAQSDRHAPAAVRRAAIPEGVALTLQEFAARTQAAQFVVLDPVQRVAKAARGTQEPLQVKQGARFRPALQIA
jgi:hypothetical protein